MSHTCGCPARQDRCGAWFCRGPRSSPLSALPWPLRIQTNRVSRWAVGSWRGTRILLLFLPFSKDIAFCSPFSSSFLFFRHPHGTFQVSPFLYGDNNEGSKSY